MNGVCVYVKASEQHKQTEKEYTEYQMQNTNKHTQTTFSKGAQSFPSVKENGRLLEVVLSLIVFLGQLFRQGLVTPQVFLAGGGLDCESLRRGSLLDSIILKKSRMTELGVLTDEEGAAAATEEAGAERVCSAWSRSNLRLSTFISSARSALERMLGGPEEELEDDACDAAGRGATRPPVPNGLCAVTLTRAS